MPSLPPSLPALSARREFLRSTVRWSALGGLTLLAAVLARRGSLRGDAATCRGSGVCAGCAFANGCLASRSPAAPSGRGAATSTPSR